MTNQDNTYNSVLRKLSVIPPKDLEQVNALLETLLPKNGSKLKNRHAVLALAGTWGDMSDDDFEEYLLEARLTGDDLFGRDVSL